MLRAELKEKISRVVREKAGIENPVFLLETPADPKHGDYSTNVALVLAGPTGRGPLDLASEISVNLNGIGLSTKVAPPGFINFFISPENIYPELKNILEEKETYGNISSGRDQRARVEYVSANPTGPLHIGNARGGPLGETLCRVLEKAGYEVLREYFHNDAGSQVEKLGRTVWYWYQKESGRLAEFPEEGYQGEYPREVALVALEKVGRDLAEKDLPELVQFSLAYIFAENTETLDRLGIKFDRIVKESDLLASGRTQGAVEEIKEMGAARKRDGALWFAPADEFLDDREAVMLRSSGQPTYFASDIAYHREKFTSGYDLVVDILGSNHHGHVPKLKALAKIFKFPEEKFKVILYQYVRVKRGKEVLKMSKRAGNFITAKEVLEEIGRDNLTFFLLLNSPNSHLDFDLKLAREESPNNPVYYVQYAHARCASILKKAEEAGLSPDLPVEFSLLKEKEELGLIKKMIQLPEVVEDTARDFQVQRMAHYALELARALHNFYEKHRVITGENKDLAMSRLKLVKAAKIALKNTLELLNVSSPEKM